MDPQNTNQPQESSQMPSAMPPAPAPGPHKNVGLGVLAYFGPFAIVSYLLAKDDAFVKFHAKQGLVLLVIEAVIWVLGMSFYIPVLWILIRLVNLATLILSIVGIVRAAKGEEKMLPLVGEYAKYFTF